MNQVAYQKPTHVYQVDSFPTGLAGHSHKGFTWRYYLPPELQGRASSNLLEHMVSIISPWIDIIAGRLKDGDCSLLMMDSTTSEGWTRKTNFKEDVDGIQATIMSCKIQEYSQWFPGTKNQIADALSRDMDRTDNKLTQTFFHVPSQLPTSFKIVPLPNKIVSGMTLLLQRLPAAHKSAIQ
jgi:hypothetical protein